MPTANALLANAPVAAGTTVAVAVDRDHDHDHDHDRDRERWHIETATRKQRANGTTHPAEIVARAISQAHGDGESYERVLTPATIPHDAACYLERAGFSLASSDVLSALRATKADIELAALERAQTAAADGLERARSMLAAATVVDGDDDSDTKRDDVRTETETGTETRTRSLEFRGESEGNPLTPTDVSGAVGQAVLDAGCRPVSTTVTGDDRLVADRPIEIDTLVRTPSGYHGRLVRTLVVDPHGGAERRAHVALTHAFRSVRTMAGAGDHTVSALEADLEAEIRAFGFGESDEIDVQVAGIGLEPRERPIGSGESVAVGATICVDATVGTDAGRVRLADVLARTEDDAQWLSPVSWSMRPSSE
ncbi:peptidase M24 [Natronosalvus halobius]|uniref:peptidase M24 n=1 Tax=Natronosalvus halobius TaxID=2953746 RepID=UPI00209CFBB6|nr:peptidase M24 [Natronosalvus halobius]USZ73068.1 peptidase M24 [Natronosalvus halobius]